MGTRTSKRPELPDLHAEPKRFLGLIRLSERKDDDELQEDAMSRQREDVEREAAYNGGEIVQWFEEPDTSAWRKIVRPVFEAMMVALPASDGLIAYDMDRVTRRNDVLERIISIYEEHPHLVFKQTSGELDLQTDQGRYNARGQVNAANKASADAARRMRRRHRQVRERGHAYGGGPRPFGWQDDRVKLHTREAKLIRQAVRDIISGVGVSTIVLEWNAKGITTTRGKPWSVVAFKGVLTSCRMIGQRPYRPTVNGKQQPERPALGEDGEPVVGAQTPMLDQETYDALLSVLAERSAARYTEPRNTRRYLLSGIAVCGICGGGMRGGNVSAKGAHRYSCSDAARGGCGGVTVTGPALDAHVVALAQHYYRDLRAQEPAEEWHGQERVDTIDRKLRELREQYEADDIDAEDYFPSVKRLRAERSTLLTGRNKAKRDEIKRHGAPVDVARLLGTDDPELLGRRRAALLDFVGAVVINPPTKLGPRLDVDRVKIVPAQEPTTSPAPQAPRRAARRARV